MEHDTRLIIKSFIYKFLAIVISLSKCIHFPLANESFMPKTIFIQKWKEDVGNEGSQLPFLGIQNKPIVTPNISMCACADGEINKFHFVYQTSKSLLVSKKKWNFFLSLSQGYFKSLLFKFYNDIEMTALKM